MRKALIEIATGKVINIIEVEDWQPPAYLALLEPGVANVGDTWDGTKFVPRKATMEEIARSQETESIRLQLLDAGRQALANWSSLTAVQKDAISKNLLRYVLWKESG